MQRMEQDLATLRAREQQLAASIEEEERPEESCSSGRRRPEESPRKQVEAVQVQYYDSYYSRLTSTTVPC